jgi:outer membrane protein assembly factor BamB
MALAGDALYIATGERCLRLAPDTGRVERTHEVPAAADKAPREWGYLALADELLVASSVKSGASQREHSRRMVTSVTYWDFKPTVTSDSLFAIDRASGDLRWAYAPKGAILNPTITIGGGRVYFVESPAAETLTKAQGRMPLGDLIGKGGRVVALDLKTGRALWSESCDLSAVQHNLYGVYSLEKWALVGSRNGGKDANAASVFFDVRVLEAATGKESWFKTQNQGVAINGEHGEQDLHPVAFGGRLYVEPRVYDLKSGAELETWEWKPRRGCGTMSASASTLFFRNQNPCSFDPAVRQVQRVTIVTRPGCWINMIPAGGLLLIPEGSSGCSCDFAVQGSLAFLPAPWDKSK